MEDIGNTFNQKIEKNNLEKDELHNLLTEVLLFSINNQQYGVESKFVLEVFESKQITPLPLTPEHVIGIINYRGEILPVIDYKIFAGSSIKTRRDDYSIVILSDENVRVGLIVNKVSGIKSLKWQQIKYENFGNDISEMKFLHGITISNSLIIDAKKIFTNDKLNIQDKI